MPNPQKSAVNTSKKSTASARPKASTKENPPPHSSTTTRPTAASKPLKTQSSNDAETAALIAELRGQSLLKNLLMQMAHFVSAQVDHLKKRQAAKPKEEEPEEIPRPTKFTSLQAAMGLTDNKRLYSFCRVSPFFIPLPLLLTSDAFVGSCSRCFGSFKFTNQYRLAKSRSCRHRENRCNSKSYLILLIIFFLLLNIAKASSRQKQLKLYKGNWATLEIMKTLLKNRRTYRNRIGTVDDDNDTIKKEGSEDEKDHEGNDTDSWEDMYKADKERHPNTDESDNDEDGGEPKGDDDGIDEETNGEDEDEDKGADNGDEDANLDITDSRDGDGDEGKKSNGSGCASGGKDDEGRSGVKRKNRDDVPVTRAKKTKQDIGGGHQAATQSKKNIPAATQSKKNKPAATQSKKTLSKGKGKK